MVSFYRAFIKLNTSLKMSVIRSENRYFFVSFITKTLFKKTKNNKPVSTVFII